MAVGGCRAEVARLAPASDKISARVTSVSGATVVISAGAKSGIQVGDRFEVARAVNEIRDPVSKNVLDANTEVVGDLVITEVREDAAVGTYTGLADAKVGDAAQKRLKE